MKTLAALFIFLLAFPCGAHSASAESTIERALELKLHQRPEWLRLVHYERTWRHRFESQADGQVFFVSSQGKSDPQAELIATIRGFFQTEKREFDPALRIPAQAVRCQFPARWRWLSRELGLNDQMIPKVNCSEYQEWYERLKPQSATLVFSAYYLNNPSSSYGHTLIRINKSQASQGSERATLLDYGINFAATATVQNPVLYAIYGVSGLFPGHFSSIPYYYKVREYNDFESRDLWEYDLNLTHEQLLTLVEHFWELGSTHFDYYYLTENCSYHMLTALDVAVPGLDLADRTPYWVIPADTVKVAYETPGLISGVHFRPSVRTQLWTRYDRLISEDEKKAFGELISQSTTPTHLASLSEESKANVYDAAMDYVDYKHAKKLLAQETSFTSWKQRLLIDRSKLPQAVPLTITPPKSSEPHRSHDSARFGVHGIKNSKNEKLLETSMRFALHDLSDPGQGYPSNAKIEMFHFATRYNETRNTLRLSKAILASVDSFAPWTTLEKPIAWRMHFGADTLDDSRCTETCLALQYKGAAGLAWHWMGSPRLLQYVMASGTVSGANKFESGWLKPSAGPLTGVRLAISDQISLHAETGIEFDFRARKDDVPRSAATLRYSPLINWAIDVQWSQSQRNRETLIGAFHYF